MTALIILGVIALLLVLMYNSLVGKKNQVENIFGSVDAVLKKRYDLIPNLVASVQQYMAHEKGLLNNITELRAQAMKPDISDHKKIALDKEITSALGSIMVAVENYPDLKANQNVMHLQHTLNEVEAQISAARRAYNQAVTDYNNAIEMIPTNFMASMMNYRRKEVFAIPQEERQNVNVNDLFSKKSNQPMASVNELTDFYYNELYPELKILEEERKQLKSRVLTVFGFIALTTVSIALVITKNAGFSDIVFFILFAGFALGGIVYKLMVKDYTSGFKLKIIHPLIKAISSDLNYAPLYYVSESLFSHSKLFTQSVDRFQGNDHVKGVIDGIPIEFSDLHAEHKTKDSKGRTSWSTVFQGLFIVADFNKYFKGNTIVVPDTAESTFGSFIGNWMQANNYARNDLIKMDDPAFEKEFVVYGTDQIEAHYILTHTMMQRLLDLRKKAGHDIYVSFHGTKIYIAIDYRDDMFEPKLFSSLLEYKTVMAYTQTLHLATGIIKELKLNERLWSKH